jgi:hypothetical protein
MHDSNLWVNVKNFLKTCHEIQKDLQRAVSKVVSFHAYYLTSRMCQLWGFFFPMSCGNPEHTGVPYSRGHAVLYIIHVAESVPEAQSGWC